MTNLQFGEQIARIEGLVHQMEAVHDSELRTNAMDLVRAVMELHGAGLGRIMEIVSKHRSGDSISKELAQDDLVSSLLLLYDLHPDDLETRVTRALDGVRPYLQSHGGNLELLGIDDGVVRIRLQGSCYGCPSSAVTSQQTIENAIYGQAPEIVAVEVEGATKPSSSPPGGFVQLEIK